MTLIRSSSFCKDTLDNSWIIGEETGAIDFTIEPITVYSVTRKNADNNEDETFGMLFYAEVHSFENTLENEIEEIKLFDRIPVNLTYPGIQPYLYNKVIEMKSENK